VLLLLSFIQLLFFAFVRITSFFISYSVMVIASYFGCCFFAWTVSYFRCFYFLCSSFFHFAASFSPVGHWYDQSHQAVHWFAASLRQVALPVSYLRPGWFASGMPLSWLIFLLLVPVFFFFLFSFSIFPLCVSPILEFTFFDSIASLFCIAIVLVLLFGA
jgi:hypothetical protein